MATCPSGEQLMAYHDGEVDAAVRAQIERHLAGCGRCMAELAGLDGVSLLFAAAPRPNLSQISRARLHRAVDGAMEQGVLRLARALAAIAACVLVGGSAWLATVRDAPQAAAAAAAPPPPWVGVAAAAAADTGADAANPERATPAAQWYLADASPRSTDELQ